MALDIKDAFFFFLLALVSQPTFAFEWTEQEGGYMDLVATGVKNSPALFSETLSADMLEFRQKYSQSILLQLVDDLIASTTGDECG